MVVPVREGTTRSVHPPGWFLAALMLQVVLHLALPVSRVMGFPWQLTGLTPVFLGVWLDLSADKRFKRRRTTVKPTELPSFLITDGPFRLSRHPMYLGMVLILLGIALLLGTLSPLVVPVAFGILIDRLDMVSEEIVLERRFGEDYRVYRRRVRRWI